MILTDTHCHLYLEDFDTDRAEVIARAENEGVKTFYLPAIDHSVTAALLKMEADFPGRCFGMAGLHPCSVKEGYEQELRLVEKQLEQRVFAAVGEVGLDFYWDKTFTAQQYAAFEHQIELAKRYRIPLVIHSRNAMQECIDLVKKHRDELLTGIFHCFTGSYEEAVQIMDTGFYMGIGGVITYKNAGLAETAARLPLEYMVLETDAPYLSPVPFRGKRNESSYLKYIAEKLAVVKGVPVEAVAEATTANAQKIFGR